MRITSSETVKLVRGYLPRLSTYFTGDPDKMLESMLLAHTEGRKAIKAERSLLPVGFALAIEDDQAPPPETKLEGHVEQKRKQVYDPWFNIAKSGDYTGVPVLVTENGVDVDDDMRRIEFIRRAVAGVERCRKDGVDVRSYIHWTLIDNFEWVSGYGTHMGLVAVDRATQKRTPKPSAYLLGGLAKGSRS